MSIRAVAWALNESPTDDPATRLILVAMAEVAHDDGTACFLSHKTIAEKACVSEATVKRRLRELKEEGLLVPGDESLVSHYPVNRRPNVWNLALWRQRSITADTGQSETDDRGVNLTPQESRGVTESALGGQQEALGGSKTDLWGVTGDLQTTHKPKAKPSINHTEAGASAAKLLAEWLEHCTERPPERVVGQMATEIRKLFEEGIGYERVRAGVAALHHKRANPVNLPSFVQSQSHIIPMQGERVNRRPTSDDRFRETMDLVAQYVEQPYAQYIENPSRGRMLNEHP